jgi:transcriptional regulator with XRE-family HTH domain
VVTISPAPARRAELAAFLRSRRARLTPEAVGLPPGLRRRTPGLRREEIAQLAGVGVTWYTWLEQGRPINASVQVIDAVARTLRLDPAEREHLYRLAEVPSLPELPETDRVEPAVQDVLDSIEVYPAGVYNSRFDLLAWNESYGKLFPHLVAQPPGRRNALWHIFTARSCCCPFVNRTEELPLMVASMRSGFARHLGEPAWEGFVRALSRASPEFAEMWAAHDVALPGSRIKIFRHSGVGELAMATTSFAVSATPETRMIVYTPLTGRDRERMAALRELPLTDPCCAGHCPGI